VADDSQSTADRIELFATIVLTIATILTAWSAFQASKWSGVQAIHFSEAAATRTESTKTATTAGQQTIIDVNTFTSWLNALSNERRVDPSSSRGPDGLYQPDPSNLSGFLFERFRDEFKPVVDEWLTFDPEYNPEAPPTPFALASYENAAQEETTRLETLADRKAQTARDDNQRSDNYVLTTVIFAAVLFFGGVSSKLRARRNQLLALGFAVLVLVGTVAVVLTFPIEI
jgi:hypothetical protein